jgi:hypothetical protein
MSNEPEIGEKSSLVLNSDGESSYSSVKGNGSETNDSPDALARASSGNPKDTTSNNKNGRNGVKLDFVS